MSVVITPLSPESRMVEAITANDSVMRGLTAVVGQIDWRIQTDPFQAVSRAIVGQQLSSRAARALWTRLRSAYGELSAEAVAKSPAALSQIGLSSRKATYIMDLAVAAVNGEIDPQRFLSREDNEVIEELTRFRGVGRWTAEMFLIFSLGRPDVLSIHDAGLRRSIEILYDERSPLDEPGSLYKRAENWRPFRTIASLYLWKALDLGVIG